MTRAAFLARARGYNRRSIRRKAARRLTEINRGRGRCALRIGRYVVCGGRLETVVYRDGSTRTSCPRCERRLRGICQDCPRPVEGQPRKALRCHDCKRRARRDAMTRYVARHPDYLERQRRRWGRIP